MGEGGGQHFPWGGGSTFPVWVQLHIAIETYRTCDFQEGLGHEILSETASYHA